MNNFQAPNPYQQVDQMYNHYNTINISNRNRFVWFVFVIIGIFFFSFSFANTIYFHKIHKAPPPNISPSETRLMTGVNITFMLLSGITIIYFAWRLHTHTQRTTHGLLARESMLANPGVPMPASMNPIN